MTQFVSQPLSPALDASQTKPSGRRPGRRLRARADSRRIILIVAGCLAVALLAVASLAPGGSGYSETLPGFERSVRAYQTATGVYAVPAAGQVPAEYVAAEEAAVSAGNPLAFTVWVDQESFEQRAWRDLLQAGRIPLVRPPSVIYHREVVVLVWPVLSTAPNPLAHAPGLLLDGVTLRSDGLEIRVSPSTSGPAPAPPSVAPGTAISPYVLVTIPRTQWPRPVPPPVVPPVTVTLAR
jgi:hypothetical protein